MGKDIEKLRPKTKELCKLWLEKCKEANIPVIITQAFRTPEEQTAIYMQGRHSLEEINKYRKDNGMYLIDAEDNIIVSKAKSGMSPHEFSLAFDFALLINGKASWNDTNPLWLKAIEIAESLNIDGYTLECGYRWTKFKDSPHIQLKNWKEYK